MTLPGKTNREGDQVTLIFVVTNGNGGEIDSAWMSQAAAQARADKLNAGANETLAFGVLPLSLNPN